MKKNRNLPRSLPYQAQGTRFLSTRLAAALFDEQGLGKTKQVIDAIVKCVGEGSLDGAVVLCPNHLKVTWQREIAKYAAGAIVVVLGAGKTLRRRALTNLRGTFYVVNYEAVARERVVLQSLLRFRRFALILDESHRIKTPTAAVTRAVLAIRSDAARRYILTGTPIANRPEDIWSQLFFLDDGISLGTSFEDFRRRYCTPAGGYVNMEELRTRIGSVSLRRLKETALRLPAKTVVRTCVRLAGRQLFMYDRMRSELMLWVKDLSGADVATHAEAILARLVRLAQLASNPRLLDASYSEVPAKVVALDRLLDVHLADGSRKVIVWTSFVGNVRMLVQRYARYNPVAIHGGVDRASRDASVDAFKEDPAVRLMIANPAAAREGLTLTEADTAIYVDRTFNLVDFLQSQDRIHRLSQTRECTIVLLLAEHTIDEFIDFALAQKHRLAAYAQDDSRAIAEADLALKKPDVLRALLGPSF